MNRYVLITRHPADCGEIRQLLRPHDIEVRPFPVLRLEEIDPPRGLRSAVEAVPTGHPGWLLLASPRAARPFVDQANRRGARHLLDLAVAAVGRTTAAAAATRGRVGLSRGRDRRPHEQRDAREPGDRGRDDGTDRRARHERQPCAGDEVEPAEQGRHPRRGDGRQRPS